MPAYSTLRTFINALRSGETNITSCLEQLMNDSQKRVTFGANLAATGALNKPFPGWMRSELSGSGMSGPEIDHVENWPDAQKEIVRVEIAQAIAQNRPLRFSWELFDGPDPVSDVRSAPGQDVRVAFRSPRKGVRLSSVNFGSVHVEA